MPNSLLENLQELKAYRPVPDPEEIRIPINHRQKALRATLQVAWWAKLKSPPTLDSKKREAKGAWGNSPAPCFEERREWDCMSHRESSDKVERTTGPARVEEKPGVFMARESYTDRPETGQTAQVPGQASRHLGVNTEGQWDSARPSDPHTETSSH